MNGNRPPAFSICRLTSWLYFQFETGKEKDIDCNDDLCQSAIAIVAYQYGRAALFDEFDPLKANPNTASRLNNIQNG